MCGVGFAPNQPTNQTPIHLSHAYQGAFWSWEEAEGSYVDLLFVPNARIADTGKGMPSGRLYACSSLKASCLNSPRLLPVSSICVRCVCQPEFSISFHHCSSSLNANSRASAKTRTSLNPAILNKVFTTFGVRFYRKSSSCSSNQYHLKVCFRLIDNASSRPPFDNSNYPLLTQEVTQNLVSPFFAILWK